MDALFCTPTSPDTSMSRFVCGLQWTLGGGSSNVDVEVFVDEEEHEMPPAVSWLVATGPKALQRPIIMNKRGFEVFRNLEGHVSDILVTGYPRCGLSWAHAIIFFLARSSDNGTLEKGELMVGGRGPVYCETRNADKVSAHSVLAQHAPRLLTTHSRPGNWPDVKGKVVIITRDPRDALVSTFFRIKQIGEELRTYENVDGRIAKCANECLTQTLEQVFDDFNDDGSGKSVMSLLMEDDEALPSPRNPRFYGDWFTWHSEVAKAVDGKRSFVIGYEELHHDAARVVRRLAKFLEIPINDEKVARCVEYAGFDATRARGDAHLRKGVVGDHRIYLTQEHWDAMAKKTRRLFGHRPLYEPLTRFMFDNGGALSDDASDDEPNDWRSSSVSMGGGPTLPESIPPSPNFDSTPRRSLTRRPSSRRTFPRIRIGIPRACREESSALHIPLLPDAADLGGCDDRPS